MILALWCSVAVLVACCWFLLERVSRLESFVKGNPEQQDRLMRRLEKLSDDREKETEESLLDIWDRIEEMGGGIFSRRRK